MRKFSVNDELDMAVEVTAFEADFGVSAEITKMNCVFYNNAIITAELMSYSNLQKRRRMFNGSVCIGCNFIRNT